MADLPQPTEPEGHSAEAYRRQALEATLAEALRDARLTGRPAPSTSSDGRPAGGRDQADPSPTARPAPSLIGSMRAAGSASASAGGGRTPTGSGSNISRLVPPTMPSRPAGGQIGGSPSGVAAGGLSGIGTVPIGRLGSDGLEPDDVHAVIELRRPARKAPGSAPQTTEIKAPSGGPQSGHVDPSAAPSQKSGEIASRDDAARRSKALSLIAPWTPECDDILPGLTTKRQPRGLKASKDKPAKHGARSLRNGKSKKR